MICSARAWRLPLSELEDALVHTVSFIMENVEQFIFPLYVTGFNWIADHFEIQIHGNSAVPLGV